ncbi:hypothetical protein Bca4012_089351 [Brassica carinata]
MRKSLKGSSLQVFYEEEAVASISFTLPKFAPSHHDLERLHMRFLVGGTVVHGNFEHPRIGHVCLYDPSSEESLPSLLEKPVHLGCVNSRVLATTLVKKNPAATALMANAYANTAVPEKIKNLVAIFRLRENTKTSSPFHHPNRKGNDKIYQST